MSKVTCIAKLQTVSLSTDSAELKFVADYQDGRNQRWAPYTPALSFSMSVKREVYENSFELDGSYLVTFEDNNDSD